MYLLFLLKCIFIASLVCFTSVLSALETLNGSCMTPENSTGTCLRLSDCPKLFSLVKSVPQNPNNREKLFYLRRSQCGIDTGESKKENSVLVCCAETSTPTNTTVRLSSRSENIAAIQVPAPAPAPTSTPNKNVKAESRLSGTQTGIPDGNVLPSAGICGNTFSNRIIGGLPTHIDEFPWMVLIVYKKSDDTFSYNCGGSLITSRYILTAAHCVNNVNLAALEVHSVRLGEWQISTNPDCEVDAFGKKDCAPEYVDVRVDSFVVHESYNPTSLNQFHDIALIRLKERVAYTDFIKPICLPIAKGFHAKDLSNHTFYVAGWGKTKEGFPSDIKLKIEVGITDHASCEMLYRKTFNLTVDKEQQLCVGGQEKKDTCQGDSGGSLMVIEQLEERNVFVAAGIVSFGPEPCGLKGWSGIYTRTSHYLDWIVQNLKP